MSLCGARAALHFMWVGSSGARGPLRRPMSPDIPGPPVRSSLTGTTGQPAAPAVRLRAFARLHLAGCELSHGVNTYSRPDCPDVEKHTRPPKPLSLAETGNNRTGVVPILPGVVAGGAPVRPELDGAKPRRRWLAEGAGRGCRGDRRVRLANSIPPIAWWVRNFVPCLVVSVLPAYGRRGGPPPMPRPGPPGPPPGPMGSWMPRSAARARRAEKYAIMRAR